jgi:predicted TIM-barrel fold metal-dependent hydrolase
MTLTRRSFVGQVAAALAVTATMQRNSATSLAADEADKSKTETLPIIDTHQHLWDLDKFKLPWLGSAPGVLQRSYTMPDYLAATDGLNVARAVYMEVDVAPEQQVAEAEYLLGICAASNTPTAGAVISGRPNSPEFREYILKFKDNPYIKGVRQVLHSPDAKQGLCLEPQFVKSIQLLGELGKSFDLCMRPGELADGVRLVDQCRKTQFIVDHCGNADPKAFLPESARRGEVPSHTVDGWRRDMAELARRENVVCKISGIVARVPAGDWKAEILAPIINYCLDTFGPTRVIFGGDWPVCLLGASYRRWVESLREIIRERPLVQQKQLLHDNAFKLYSLRA